MNFAFLFYFHILDFSAENVLVVWRYDTQHNDTQHNDTQHNDTQHNDTQHNDTQHNELICDTHHK